MLNPIVLLVDADPDSLAIYALMLEHHGLRARIARSTAEGLRLARELLPDVVVADPFLAPTEGRCLLELLRGHPRTKHLRVIGLTSVGTAPGLQACDRRLVKPCTPTRLLREVQLLLGPGPLPRPAAPLAAGMLQTPSA